MLMVLNLPIAMALTIQVMSCQAGEPLGQADLGFLPDDPAPE